MAPLLIAAAREITCTLSRTRAAKSMLSFRTTAALAGLLPAFALCGGAASYPALSPGGTLSTASQLGHVRPAARISRSALRVAVRQHYGPAANASGYSVLVVTGARQA